ncbi:amino acid adenylation domain-containing protein [Serratia sp. NPDC078593]|uniref:amino acid adenylation domain-containing protein n=1 Tax=unclassified Serratia (in: enterobacteria) TaxID=2647522 RepID=UPI0037D700CA
MNYRKPIFETIANWSIHRPDENAVTFCDQTLSYSQLEYQSNLLARYISLTYPLHSRGRIAVYLEPSLMMPVVLLAILKAGCAYVPLSHFQPKARITKILDDASVFLLLTTRSVIHASGIDKLFPATLALEDINYSDTAVSASLPTVQASDLAYILYTSGSTGTPKGVAIEHRNLSYYLSWFNQQLWPETQALLPLTSTLSFAAAVTQLYAPLLRGETLHILPADSLHEPGRLLTWYQQHPKGAIYCVPTVWDELLRYQRDVGGALSLPKTIFLSGEPVPFDLKERTFEQCPEATVYNLYGPTEATANGSFSRLEKHKPVTLGKALRESKILIVDENLTPVEAGQSGEICIVGEGVARGYLNQDSLTQQRFFRYQCEGGDVRGHRTGDLGLFNAQGDVVYLGRINRQIKINGVRIEPEEIEIALREHEKINQALVRTIDDDNGSVRLIAYLVSADTALSINEISAFLRAKLPAPMIPTYFMTLETLPKLPNGKLDLQRLPMPSPIRPVLGYAYRPASNELEQELIDIFQDILGFRDLGADDNFFDLGGGSLQVMQARQCIRRRLFSDIDYALFFNNATPYLLSFIVPYYVNDEETFSSADCELESAPLSGEQRYFLTLDQISPDPLAYLIAFRLHLHGPLDVAALEWCVQRIVQHNPVLRSRFDLDSVSCREGQYPSTALQVIHQQCADGIIADGKVNDERLLASVGISEIDLEHTPLISIKLLSAQDTQHILFVQVHHTVFDHDSIGAFFQQFVDYARAYHAGDHSFTLAPSKRYQHYRQWQQCAIWPTRYPKERRFWQKTFAEYVQTGADGSQFQPQADQDGENYRCTVSVALTQSLRAFARHHQTTVFVSMLAAFNRLLNSATCYRHVPIGIPVSNRTLYEETDLLGCFVNRVTYYDPAIPDEPMNTAVARCHKRIYAILDNQMVPYDILNNDIRENGWSEKLYAPVCFNYLSAMPSPVKIGDTEIQVSPIEHHAARVDLTLSVHEGNNLQLYFNYHKNALTKTQVKILAEAYIELLSAMVQSD